MLTTLDESLLHQLALPFEQAGVSDHRFFDRIIIGSFHPESEAAFIAGMGVYKNMNVMDGFVFAQARAKRQYNVRFSKALRPITSPTASEIGPLKLETIKAFDHLRLVLEPGRYPLALDLHFSAILSAHLENPHLGRLDGRLHTDYLRYHQLGEARGWIDIDGERFDMNRWFAWRDHSWGIRPNVGGFEPHTGTKAGSGLPSAVRSGESGILVCHVGFSSGGEAGGVQFIENGQGVRLYTDGVVGRAGDLKAHGAQVTTISHDITFHPGTRVVDTMTLELGLGDGTKHHVHLETQGRPFVYKGGGYDNGFVDGKGHGVWRSQDLLIEQDDYDVSDIEAVGFPDGGVLRPVHREQFGRAFINGAPGFAYMPCIVVGAHPRYGIAGQNTSGI